MNKLLYGLLAAWIVSQAVAGELSDQFMRTVAKTNEDFVERDKDGNAKGSRTYSSGRREAGITEIAIERAGCYGTCPIYTAKISRDGTVSYAGDLYVDRLGSFRAQASPSRFDDLAEFAVKIGYRDFSPVYDSGVTDDETVYTRVTYADKKVKIVSNYANCGPVTLWALEQLIDKIVTEATDWKKVDSEAKPGAAKVQRGH
jgi:hypothetical protein